MTCTVCDNVGTAAMAHNSCNKAGVCPKAVSSDALLLQDTSASRDSPPRLHIASYQQLQKGGRGKTARERAAANAANPPIAFGTVNQHNPTLRQFMKPLEEMDAPERNPLGGSAAIACNGLPAETRKTSRSVPSNIAEGHKRGSTAEYIRFPGIAADSTAELETRVLLAGRLGYLEGNTAAKVPALHAEVESILDSLIRNLKAKIDLRP